MGMRIFVGNEQGYWLEDVQNNIALGKGSEAFAVLRRGVGQRIIDVVVAIRSGRINPALLNCHGTASYVFGHQVRPTSHRVTPIGESITALDALERFGSPCGMQLHQVVGGSVEAIHSAVVLPPDRESNVPLVFHKPGEEFPELLPIPQAIRWYHDESLRAVFYPAVNA